MKKLIIFLLLGFATQVVLAQSSAAGLAGTAIDTALKTVMNNLESIALRVLFALSVLQFTITGYGLVASGEIEASMGKFAKFIIWTAFCLWLLKTSDSGDGLSNGGHFIQSSVDGFLTLAGTWAGNGGSSFNTTDIVDTGFSSYGLVMKSVGKSLAGNPLTAALTLFVPGVSLMTLIMSFFIGLVMIITCGYIALKVFMVKLELAIMVAMSSLSFALLGLTGLRDQGFAPLKGMLALIYRVVVLGATVSAMSTMSKYLSNHIATQPTGLIADVWTPLMSAAFGFVILAFVAHKSDSIASSLANGSASMGSGDVATAAATGAAVGAAIASGGASAVGATGNIGKALTGAQAGTASVANASAKGAGGDLMKMAGGGGAPKSSAPVSGSGGGGGGGGSSASPGGGFATNSKGAPIRPEPPASAGTSGTGSAGSGGKDGSSGVSNTPAGGDFASAAQGINPGAEAANMAVMQEMVATNPGVPKTSEQISGYAARLQPEGPSGKPEASESSGGSPVSGGGGPSGGGASTAPDSPVGSAPKSSGSGGAGSANTSPPAGGFATNSRGAPIRPEPPASASGAGIGGAAPSAQNAQTVANMGNQGAPKKSMVDHLAEINQHVAKESQATHISINTQGEG